jgi:hypothetical protein
VVELRDQLVDALRDVPPLLVRLEQALLERVDPTRLLLDLAAQARVLLPQPTVRPGQRLDGALEPAEVVVVALPDRSIRNGRTPVARDRTDANGTASSVSELALAGKRRDAPWRAQTQAFLDGSHDSPTR